MEYSQTLVPPQPHKVGRLVKSLRNGERETMVNAGEIPQVEDVVELGGSGWEVTYDTVVQLQSGCGDALSKLLYSCTAQK